MGRGYLTTKEIKRLKWLKNNVLSAKGNFIGTEAQKKEFEDLNKRWERQKANSKRREDDKERERKKENNLFSGNKQTDLSKDQFKGGEGKGYTMNTGGGEPISRGKKWPDEPEKERVEQPHAPNGEFTFNSVAGLDKKDKRDRAKGTGFYSEDPALSGKLSRDEDDYSDAIGAEYKRKKEEGEGFKSGEVIQLKDGSTVVCTHDLSLDEFYKYFMTHYKDKAGEIRNALLENGFFVKIGDKFAEEDGFGKVNYISLNRSNLGARLLGEVNKAANRWKEFVEKFSRNKGLIETKEALPKVLGGFLRVHQNRWQEVVKSKLKQQEMLNKWKDYAKKREEAPAPAQTPAPAPENPPVGNNGNGLEMHQGENKAAGRPEAIIANDGTIDPSKVDYKDPATKNFFDGLADFMMENKEQFNIKDGMDVNGAQVALLARKGYFNNIRFFD